MASHLDKAGKARILALSEAGMLVKSVCEKVGQDRWTVQRLRREFLKQSQEDQEHFTIHKRKPGQERPESISAGNIAKMRRMIIHSPRITAKKLKARIHGLKDCPV